MDGAVYDENGLRTYSKQEREQHPGKYDDDGFYLLDDGGFFDDLGYFFDKDGFNEIGGFYDPGHGNYISPNDFDEDYNKRLEEYYDELCISDDESDKEGENAQDIQEEYGLTEAEIKNGIKREHCLPVLAWLSEQPSDQTHVVKISNIPRQATEDMLRRKLQKTVKNFTIEKLVIEKDKNQARGNLGVAWVSSNDQVTLKQLIKMHYYVSLLEPLNKSFVGLRVLQNQDVVDGLRI